MRASLRRHHRLIIILAALFLVFASSLGLYRRQSVRRPRLPVAPRSPVELRLFPTLQEDLQTLYRKLKLPIPERVYVQELSKRQRARFTRQASTSSFNSRPVFFASNLFESTAVLVSCLLVPGVRRCLTSALTARHHHISPAPCRPGRTAKLLALDRVWAIR